MRVRRVRHRVLKVLKRRAAECYYRSTLLTTTVSQPDIFTWLNISAIMSEEHKDCNTFDKALAENGTSELGLKSHWDEVFARDLSLWTTQEEMTEANNRTTEIIDADDSDSDDREIGGHCWFGSQVSKKMVDFITPHCSCCNADKELIILDVGTGNGDLLFRLAKKLRNSSSQSNNPINARFIGMDYCQDAIQLAKSLAQSRLEREAKVEWVVDDALHVKNLTKSSIDIILDKGTFDAIASNGCSQMVKQYVKSLTELGKDETLLCITSANFIVEELNNVMDCGGWQYQSHVTDYPTFKYNGITGTHVRTVLYKLNK